MEEEDLEEDGVSEVVSEADIVDGDTRHIRCRVKRRLDKKVSSERLDCWKS